MNTILFIYRYGYRYNYIYIEICIYILHLLAKPHQDHIHRGRKQHKYRRGDGILYYSYMEIDLDTVLEI